MSLSVLTVSQVNSYLKLVIDGDQKLKNIFVSGEISNFKCNSASGHFYFSLKDSAAVLNCVMFSSSAARVRFTPKSGMKVIVMGRVSIYEAAGQYQLYVTSMQPEGIGELALAFEQLKEKLDSQGIFDETHKLSVPAIPKRIGVITSPTGAVIEDIKNVVSRRFPMAEVCLYPSAVQGSEAALQLLRGVQYFNENKNADVIIIGRGGGSFEDLYCFNDEALVRAIYNSTIPIISAVGHETDFTLCDFAADLRAPTPSAAAELAVPDRQELLRELDSMLDTVRSRVYEKLQTSYQDIDRLNDTLLSLEPRKNLERETLALYLLSVRMNASIRRRLDSENAKLDLLANSINSLSPIILLRKGYTYTTKNEKCVKSVSDITAGDTIKIRFADGEAQCSVINTTTRRTQ